MKKRIIMLSFIFAIIGFDAWAMDAGVKSGDDYFYSPLDPVTLHDIDDVPVAYAALANKLAGQPIFDGYGSDFEICKVLPLNSCDDCRISELLSANASVGSYGFGIDMFDAMIHALYTKKHMRIDGGIMLWLNRYVQEYSFSGYLGEYESIIHKLKTGWVSILKKCPPDIMFKKPQNEWYLFIKKEQLVAEDVLIRMLIDKFNLGECVACMNEWLKKSGDYEYRGMVYLWVKKEFFDEFNRKFKFYYRLPQSLN